MTRRMFEFTLSAIVGIQVLPQAGRRPVEVLGKHCALRCIICIAYAAWHQNYDNDDSASGDDNHRMALFLQVSNYLHYNALLKLGFISEVIGCPTPKVGRSKLLEERDSVAVLCSLLKIKVILNF